MSCGGSQRRRSSLKRDERDCDEEERHGAGDEQQCQVFLFAEVRDLLWRQIEWRVKAGNVLGANFLSETSSKLLSLARPYWLLHTTCSPIAKCQIQNIAYNNEDF